MKKNKITFLIAEVILLVAAIFFIHKIFEGNTAQKRVAVIIQNSGDKRWDALIKGLKQSAQNNDLHLIICNTDDIESAQDEEELINEQLENNVDAFIICPAPGKETSQVFKKLQDEKPFVLITQDVYTTDKNHSSGFTTVKADNYELGHMLGEQLAKKDKDALKDKKIGVVTGNYNTEESENRLKGFCDSLKKYDCKISWEYNQTGSQDVSKSVAAKAKVDYLAVLNATALDAIGDSDSLGKIQIYGIGTSVKSVTLLDAGKIKGLIIPDNYGIGYESVNEIAKKLNHRFYTMKSHKAEVKIIYKKDLFSDDIERFLYSYE